MMNGWWRPLGSSLVLTLLLSTSGCLPAEYWAKDAQERVSLGMTREEVLNVLGPPTYEEWEPAVNNNSLNYEFHPAATVVSVVGGTLLAVTVIGLICVMSATVALPTSFESHELTSEFIVRFDQADQVKEILQVHQLPRR